MRIAVGISGGVDSSVAAYLLKKEGHDVFGMFMINWHDSEGTLYGNCPWEDDLAFARMTAKHLDIPLEIVDLSFEYKKRIADYMFAEYEAGRTPNPDVLCNREIKWDVFLKEALNRGAEKVATGHYCQIEFDGITNEFKLKAGKDITKDQSYFLCQVNNYQLSKALFPIGSLLKSEVRDLANKIKLPNASRKDSQGLCFIGKIDLPTFLKQKLSVKEGPIIEIDNQLDNTSRRNTSIKDRACAYKFDQSDGKIIAKHQGAHFYTIGQRKGLNIGGTQKPLYVIDTNIYDNTIYVGQGKDHFALQREVLFIKDSDIHWIRDSYRIQIGTADRFLVRHRYRQPLQDATLHREKEGIYIEFKNKQIGITPGQFAAWYKKSANDIEILGSGIIS